MAKIVDMSLQPNYTVAGMIDNASIAISHAINRLKNKEILNDGGGLDPQEIKALDTLINSITSIRKELQAQQSADVVQSASDEELLELAKQISQRNK
jgi:hypothetical protein